MFLYDKKEKTIDIYEMEPNLEKIKEFSKKELEEKIKEEEVIFQARTDCNRVLEMSNSVRLRELNSTESGFYGGNFSHDFLPYEKTEEERLRQKELLNKYYQGKFVNRPLVTVRAYDENIKKDKTVKYLLLTERYLLDYNGTSVMNNIISLPQSLYLLQLLRQGKFWLIDEEADIKKQLEMFDISLEPIKKLDIAQLKEIDEMLLSNTLPLATSKVKTSQKILQKRNFNKS